MSTTAPEAPPEETSGDVTEAQRPHLTIKLPGRKKRKTGAKATAHIAADGEVTMIRLRDRFSAWITRKATGFRNWLAKRSTFTKYFVFFGTIAGAAFLSFFASYLFAYGAFVPALAWAGETAFGWSVLTAAGEMTVFGSTLFVFAEFIGVVGGVAAFISSLGPIDRYFGFELY